MVVLAVETGIGDSAGGAVTGLEGGSGRDGRVVARVGRGRDDRAWGGEAVTTMRLWWGRGQ